MKLAFSLRSRRLGAYQAAVSVKTGVTLSRNQGNASVNAILDMRNHPQWSAKLS